MKNKVNEKDILYMDMQITNMVVFLVTLVGGSESVKNQNLKYQ